MNNKTRAKRKAKLEELLCLLKLVFLMKEFYYFDKRYYDNPFLLKDLDQVTVHWGKFRRRTRLVSFTDNGFYYFVTGMNKRHLKIPVLGSIVFNRMMGGQCYKTESSIAQPQIDNAIRIARRSVKDLYVPSQFHVLQPTLWSKIKCKLQTSVNKMWSLLGL